jgi:hypothetical protein
MPDALDDLIANVPAPASAAAKPARVRRPARPAMESFQPDGAAWSINRAPEVEDFYQQSFGRALPVTAHGESKTHERMGLDHANSLDVGLHPDSTEGQALITHLRAQNIPFLAFRHAVPGAATAAHIHVGYPSHGWAAATDALDQVLARVPTTGVQPSAPQADGDALDQLLSDVPAQTAKTAPGVSVVRSGADENGAGEFWFVDEQGRKTRRVQAGDELPPEPDVDPAEVVHVNASKERAPVASSSSLAPLPARPDPYSEEGRQQRDAQTVARGEPDARLALDLSLPEGGDDWSSVTSNQMAQIAARQFARSRGIPDEFTSAWLAEHGHALKTYDLQSGASMDGADVIGRPGVYDGTRRTVRVAAEMPHLLQLQHDYEAQRNQVERAVDWATDDTHSAGEKALDVAVPVVHVGAKALDYASRPLRAVDNTVWSTLRGNDSLQPIADAFMGREPNAQEQNPIAQAIADSDTLARINPHLPALAGAATEMLTSPSNALLPLAGELKGTRAAARVGEVVEGIGEAGRAERFAAGGRVLNVESPLRNRLELLRAQHVEEVARAADELQQAHARLSSNAELSAPERADLEQRATTAEQSQRHYEHLIDLIDDHFVASAPTVPAGTVPGTPAPTATATAPPRSTARHLLDGTLDVMNAPRALMTTADLSAPGRQGLILSLTEPRAAIRAMGRQLRSFVSQGSHDELMRWLATHPDADLAEHSGLYSAMKQQAGLSGREEAFMSRIAGRLPVVKQSERAYVAYLDSLRQDTFSKYARELERAGITFDTHPDEFKSIARFINSATGRGELPQAIERFAPALNATLFAPRNLKGRFDVLNPIFYARMSPVARRIAARKMMQFVGTVTGGMYLAHLAGAQVTLNPDDPDFGKVVVGQTHYDFTGGHRSVVRVGARLGKTFAGAQGGELKRVAAQAARILAQFARQNTAPVPNYAIAAATGAEVNGDKFEWGGHLRRNDHLTPGGGALARVLPLSLQDIFDAWGAEGGRGVAKAAPAAILGVGVQSYEPKQRPRIRFSPRQ